MYSHLTHYCVKILNLNFFHTLQRGQTPFMLAVARGKPQIVNYLWTYKDKFDISVTDIVSFFKKSSHLVDPCL